MIKRVMIKAGEGAVIDGDLINHVSWSQLTISVASDSKPKICIDINSNVVLVEDDMSPDQIRRLLVLPESMIKDLYHCNCVACC